MAYDIGPKIGIEGEAEYRKALQSIITQQKTLATEMTATASAFDKGEKSMEAYTAKNAVLEKQIAAQKEKMDLLKRAVQEASDKYGEADEKTQKWQQILNRATAELNDMERELRDNKAAMEQLGDATDDLGKDLEEASGKGKSLAQTLRDNLSFTDVVNLARAAASAIREIAEALIECATGAAGFADDMNTLSIQTGVSTTRLQEFDYMAGLIDVDLNTISGAMSKTVKSMAAGKDGFDTLGVAVRDANGELRDSEAVFFEAIDALGKIENETERDALAMDLFGKSARELNPLIEAGSAKIKELAQEAHDVGYVLEEDTVQSLAAGQVTPGGAVDPVDRRAVIFPHGDQIRIITD